jgi:hypothetical protein
MEIKVVTDGTYRGTQFFNAETGEEIGNVNTFSVVITPEFIHMYGTLRHHDGEIEFSKHIDRTGTV